MKEFVIIISDGPMGSTTIASIMGNYNYLTFPLRHLGLNQYLTGKYKLNHPYFINRVKEIVEACTVPRFTGGRGIMDREEVTLFDDKIKNEIKELENKKFNSILEKYIYLYELFNRNCLYKNKIDNYVGIVELTTDIHYYDAEQIQKDYYKEFKSVKFISLKRDFKNWLNSISSMRFRKSIFSPKYILIKLSNQIKRYRDYIKFINKLENNVIISFEDIFKNEFIDELIKNLNLEKKNFKDLKFDHYGKLLNFKETFEVIDDQYYFLSKFSFKIIDYAEKYYNNKILRFFFDVIFQILSFKDHVAFKIKKKPSKR